MILSSIKIVIRRIPIKNDVTRNHNSIQYQDSYYENTFQYPVFLIKDVVTRNRNSIQYQDSYYENTFQYPVFPIKDVVTRNHNNIQYLNIKSILAVFGH